MNIVQLGFLYVFFISECCANFSFYSIHDKYTTFQMVALDQGK